MATLQILLSPQMIERLGWTLVHFVWQAAAVALLLAVVLRCLRRSSSNVRYVVSCLAMMLIVALPLVTMSLVEVSRPVAEAGPTLDTAPMSIVPVEVIEVAELPIEPFDAAVPEMPERVTHVPWMQRIATALEPALPWLVLGWLLGVFGLSAWHLGGWAQLQRMKHRMVRDVAEPLRAVLAKLSNRLGVRRTVGLLESALVDVPTVVGWLKPVILLPASALSGLTTEQLEAILAHELAHVRRCDYLVNLAQTVVEILGFYHPAVWWISHRIRDERENCCDDLAVQVCGDSRRYARALTSLEELRHVAKASRPRVREEARARCPRHTAVAASGGSLVGRITRLLGRPPIDNRRFAWLPGLIALLVVVAILIPAALLIAAPTVPQPLNTEADSAEVAGDDNVARARLVHRNVEGRADREFGFEQLIREEGGRWIVAIPYSTQSLGKMRCHMRADRGELRFEGALDQPTPDGGTFRGNVVIEIASSEPNSVDTCTLYLNEVIFSAQNKRFTGSGPVRLVADATELVGRGLELSFDEPPDLSDPSRLTVIAGVGVRIAPSGSLIVSLGDPQTEVSEASASTQRTPVGVPTETADSRAPSLEEKPRVMLDIEPSADAADRQVLLSFTIAEIVTEEALDRATARQLRALLTDASHDAKFNLPSVEELQKPVQYIVSEYANICNQIDDAARAFTDLLVSRGYATVFTSPKMLIRLGASGHLTCDAMGPPALPSQTDNAALSLDVTPTTPHDANGIRLALALRARNLVSLDSKGRFSAKAAYASFDLVLSARNNQCVMLPLTTAVALDAKTTTTLLLVKPTLIEHPATPAPWPSEQATPDAAREFVRTDPMVRELAKKIAEIQIELLEAQQTFLPEHPEIVRKKQLLEALNTRLEERRKELEQRPDAGINSAGAPDDRAQQRANAEKALAIVRGQVARVNERIDKASSAWYSDEAERSRELADLRRFKEAVGAQLQEISRIVEEQFGPPAEPEPYHLSEPSAPGTVTATFDGTDRREALRAVAEMTGVNIMCDPTVSGEVFGRVTLDDVSIEVALLAILGGSPYVATRTPDGYAVTTRDVQPPAAPSRKIDAVEVAARFVLVDRGCMEAMRRGLPIQGVTAPADVNALHEIGSGLAEGRTPLLEPDRVELLLRAVGQYAGSKMLAAPKVFVPDGESASVSLANHIQYTSGYREPNDPSQEPIPQHASKEIGVRLDATPQIIDNQNNIRLQFEMEINSLLGMQKALYRGKYEYDVPTFTAVTVDTEIVIPDGHTALIHVGPIRPFGDILSNESDPPAPMLMLIKSTRTPVRPPDPTAPMPNNPHPGDPGMGALPSGTNLR